MTAGCRPSVATLGCGRGTWRSQDGACRAANTSCATGDAGFRAAGRIPDGEMACRPSSGPGTLQRLHSGGLPPWQIGPGDYVTTGGKAHMTARLAPMADRVLTARR